jgi:hypothetical protein
VIAAWDDGFRAAHDGVAPSWDPKNLGIVKRLRESHGADEVTRRMGILFAGAGPSWLPARGTDLAQFARHFDKLAAPQRAPPPRRHASADLLDWQLRRVREAEEAEARGEEPPP